MVDGVDVDVQTFVGVEHIGNDVFIVEHLTQMVYEVFAVATLEVPNLGYLFVREFCQHANILVGEIVVAAGLVIIHTVFLCQIGLGKLLLLL